ncbi:MAG: hypothetical protein ABDH49_01700 [Candidatus Hydrothermales bacterium]
MRFYNGILYVTNEPFYAYLNSFDVTNPSNPIFLDSIGVPKYDPFSHSSLVSLDVYSNYAYCGSDSGLWIVDISDPADLKRANLLVFDGYALKIRDTLLFTNFEREMVKDLSIDPINPPEIARTNSGWSSWRIFVDSAYYYSLTFIWQPAPLLIFKLQELKIEERFKEKSAIYLDFKTLSRYKVKILYELPFSQYGRIYISDKSVRILNVFREGILKG